MAANALRIERVVAHEVIEAPVRSVAAAARHDVDYAARGQAELGRHHIGLHLEFLNGVHRGVYVDVREECAVVVTAIDDEAIQRTWAAVDAHRR